MRKRSGPTLQETWRAEWLADAQVIEVAKAKAAALESLLISRLGTVPASLREHIHEAELASLGGWFDYATNALLDKLIRRLTDDTETSPPVPKDSRKMNKDLAAMHETWRARVYATAEAIGVVKGKTEGRIEAKAEVLESLLISKFGTVPASFLKQIDQADLASLDSWLACALNAHDLPSVFDQPH